ncbi:MAG: RNA polymerase sigma factor [Dehalococcoidia bacterium]|nr:RNA polymerase sigma factor [Dehalococcoidia bacterium]
MDLVRRSLAGDREAFASIFEQYKNLVYKTAFLMLGSPEDAEDALQEVFLQAHRSLGTFEPSKGALITWLHRITVNHCLNRRRKHRLLTSSIDTVPAVLLPDHAAPHEDRLGEEEAMRQVLDRLSQKLRAVVVLRYYWDLSHHEISEVLCIPVGTVKSRLDLALKTLRTALERAPQPAQAPCAHNQTELPK